ncbi:hypothetical protein [Pseudoalteromonas rubra]|uniref:Uncharacterized protein n=1 Tax=Pseudoalteromonas rubra TaxID=43658 RepID=A0A5S3WX93_9GAMM|nr:hypothetical protein [Pseudoalteromonas rubra]TMP35850.1 hypothetical protein CWB98_15475 [Pseudoalteromonas rubra]
MKLTKLLIVLGVLCAVVVFALDRAQLSCFHCIKVYHFNVLVMPFALMSLVMLVAGLMRLLRGPRIKLSTVQMSEACDADHPGA